AGDVLRRPARPRGGPCRRPGEPVAAAQRDRGGAEGMRLLPVLAAPLLLATPAAASEQHPTLNELENQIMCPVCAGETLAQSDSPATARVKHYIQGRI